MAKDKGKAAKKKAKAPRVSENRKAAKKGDHVIAVRKKLKIDGGEPAKVVSSKVSYEGPLFRVVTDELEEPNGKHVTRDVIRHNGSVVVLAIDRTKSKKDPLVLIERQF